MNTQEIKEQVIKKMSSGSYGSNLELAIKYATMAVDQPSVEQENYLLRQSMANSLIAIALLLEDVVGYTIDNGDE